MKIFISPRSRLVTILPVIAALLFVFPQPALSAPPATPTISSVTESTNAAYGAGTLTVNWNAVSGATSYAAMITKQGTTDTPTVITNEDSTNLQATFRNLPGGTTYIVQVKAFTGVESSPWSSATRTAIPKTFPKAPAKPTVVKGIGRATVSWTALTASEKGGYEVTSYLVTELNSSKTVTATGTSTEAIVTGLTNGATVEFTVAAITAAGAAGSTSDKSDKYILDDVPSTPSAPVLATTDTSGEVKATWTAPTKDNGSSLISYTIKLFKDGIERTSEVITKIADTFYTFTSLLNGTYTSKVLATNGVGDSALSVFSNQIVIGSSASPTPTPSPTSSASPSATPSASPSASPSPSPSPTETSAPAPPSFGGGFGGGGGGFGGGFGGGGALPDAVVPLVTPSPIPSPTITPSAPAQIVPTLAPTSTARPSAIPTPSKPTPSGSVTPRPIPSPTQLPKIKSNSFIAPVQITTTTQRVVATSIKMTQNIKAGKSLSVTLPPVKKGTNVTVNVKTPDGKVIAIKTETLKKSGSYTLPALAFKKTGTYQVIVKIGSKFKTVTVKVAK